MRYEDAQEVSIWDLGTKTPSALYRLSMAVINQALLDYVAPWRSTPQIHRVSAYEFLMSPLSEVWFGCAGLKQEWFKAHLTSSSPEAKEKLKSVIKLTAHSEFAFFHKDLVP